jgi:hypothetical protein
MSFTRFFDDPYRIQCRTENSGYMGKYFLDVPSNGSEMPYHDDPHIRLQKWGANMMTNSIKIEDDLRGLTRKLNRDTLEENEYTKYSANSSNKYYDNSSHLNTDETRSSCPAWTLRGIEIPRWEEPFLNPQNNLEKKFHCNIQTRILEKDYYQPKY